MPTVSHEFDALGVSPELSIRNGESFDWALTVVDEQTFDGEVQLQRSIDGGLTWQTIKAFSGEDSGVYREEERGARFRFVCTRFEEGNPEAEPDPIEASDPITVTMTDRDDVVFEWRNRDGKVRLQVTDAGVRIFGAVTFDGPFDLPAGTTLDGLEITTEPEE